MTMVRAIRRHATVGVLAVGLAVPAFALATGAGASPRTDKANPAAAAAAASSANGSHAAANAASNSNGVRDNKAHHDGEDNAAPTSSNNNGNSKANSGASGASGAADQTVDAPAGCPNTFHNSASGNGANVSGAYDSTCDGSASLNGNGNGNATGKPCAGCVGNADDKNPPGQAPNGSDHNAGYECDTNHGVGRTNPAHTGCASQPDRVPPKEQTPPEKCPNSNAAMVDRNHDGVANADDCKDTPGTPPEKCPNSNAAMVDRNHDGVANADDCKDTPSNPHTPNTPSTPDTPGEVDIPVVHGSTAPAQVLAETVSRPAPQVLPVVEGETVVPVRTTSLPFTGTNTLNLALIADLAMLTGTLALHVGRRRKDHSAV